MFIKTLQRLTSPFNRRYTGRIGKLFRVLDTELEELKETIELIDLYKAIDQAEGIYLDHLGHNFREYRMGRSDFIYRGMIKSRILRNQSRGDMDSILHILSTFLNTEPSRIYIEETCYYTVTPEPAAIRIVKLPAGLIYEAGLTFQYMKELVENSVGAGIKVYIGEQDFGYVETLETVQSSVANMLSANEQVSLLTTSESSSMDIYAQVSDSATASVPVQEEVIAMQVHELSVQAEACHTVIYNKQDLLNLTSMHAHYLLMNDIDLEGETIDPILEDFWGRFYGNGYKIYNGKVSGGDEVGLFGKLIGAVIKDLGLELTVEGDEYVGMLAGRVAGEYTYIYNCYSAGLVEGQDYVGGLVGADFTDTSVTDKCYSTADVVAGSGQRAGGLLGFQGGEVSRCYATGSVGAGDTIAVGGLVGNMDAGAELIDSYATGSVTGSMHPGGLVGTSHGGNITNCYSTGSVGPSGNGGGLIAALYAGEVTNSYWDMQTSFESESDGGEGKTTEEMMQQSTFIDWDFEETWQIDEGESYPYLK